MKNAIFAVSVFLAAMLNQDNCEPAIQKDSLHPATSANTESDSNSLETNNTSFYSERISAINYPNPFGSSTIISYKIDTAGEVTIILYDLIGREVSRYKEGFKNKGDSRLMIDLSYLNSGVYFYEIKINGRRTAFNRLTLLK